MRYIDCCKSTKKNKKCTRKDGKHFSLQRRFTKKKCIKGPVKGFTMRASCAPYKFCKNKTRKKQRGGSEPEEKTQLPNLQQSADLLRTSLGINRQGPNVFWENQVIRLALEGDERFTHLLGEEPLVAQKEQDPQDGGRVKRTKKGKTRKLLPKLRKISYKNKKHHYRLKDPFRKRKLAIHEGVNREAKKTGKTKKKAAIAKKGRFNILRIYRKNKKIKECNTITHDMRYMDRKYGLGKTKNICGQKGGMISEFISDDEETNNEPEPNTYFIVKNTETEIKNFATEISKRIVEGQYMHHGYDTFYYLEQLEATMLEALFSRENINGFYIVTYYPNNNGAYGGFSESFYNNLQVLHEHLQITEANNRFPNNTVELEVSVLGEQDDPNTVAGVTNFTGGRKHHKKKTRKKRGAVKLGKNKTTAEIVKKGREVLKTTPLRKRRKRREQLIKDTGEKAFALFRKQSIIEMSIAFQTTFGIAPSNRDRKILSLVYKNLKEPLSEAEEDDIKKYRAEEEENKRKFVWMNNYLRQLKKKSEKKQFEIYNHGDNPKALLKYSTGKKRVKKGPATGLVINTDNKYMSPVKGPDTRYSDTNFAVEERAKNIRKSHKNLVDYFGGGRKKKTRKKRGGVERWTRETLQPNPKTFDDIGYFYDCKPMSHVGSTNKSKYRENMIITGDRDGNQLMLPNKWKIIRMDDSEFYDPQLQLVDMREREGLRGMAAFRRRAQDLCNRGYKPLERNDAKTGAGRKKKTRKKRGGWRRRDTDFNKDDIGYYYDCWNRDGNYDDVKYREGMTITGKWDVLRPISEWDIIEMQDSHRYDPNLILYDESRPDFGEFRIPAQQLCTRGFKPLKRNDAKTGAGRKKKTRRKRKKKQFLYNPNDPSKSFDVYIDKNPKDTIPIKYTTVKDVKNTIKKLERLYKTKKYPHKRIWQVGMIMKVRLEAMLKHKTKKYPNAKKVKQRFNLANKYFKFLGNRSKKKSFEDRKKMSFSIKIRKTKKRRKKKKRKNKTRRKQRGGIIKRNEEERRRAEREEERRMLQQHLEAADNQLDNFENRLEQFNTSINTIITIYDSIVDEEELAAIEELELILADAMNISNRLNEFNNESRNHLLWDRGVNMADRDLGRILHQQHSRWLDLERDISRARGILLYRVIRPADRYIEYLEDREDVNFLEEWELE